MKKENKRNMKPLKMSLVIGGSLFIIVGVVLLISGISFYNSFLQFGDSFPIILISFLYFISITGWLSMGIRLIFQATNMQKKGSSSNQVSK